MIIGFNCDLQISLALHGCSVEVGAESASLQTKYVTDGEIAMTARMRLAAAFSTS